MVSGWSGRHGSPIGRDDGVRAPISGFSPGRVGALVCRPDSEQNAVMDLDANAVDPGTFYEDRAEACRQRGLVAEAMYTGGGIWLLRVSDGPGAEAQGWTEWGVLDSEMWSGTHYPAGAGSGSDEYDAVVVSEIPDDAPAAQVAEMIAAGRYRRLEERFV
jgi:hypothetical protein